VSQTEERIGMHYDVGDEQMAAEIILGWAYRHAYHDSAHIDAGLWSRVLSCPECGKKAYTTIAIDNEAQKRAMSRFEAGSRVVMF
jgi:hypothetical protein